MTPEERKAETETEEGVKVYFNPFAFTIEQNNEFLAKGYEVMPLRIPKGKNDPRRTQGWSIEGTP